MYACLGVIATYNCWQNDRGLLRATEVTRGWNGRRISVSTESHLRRRKFSRRSCPEFELATFRPRVRPALLPTSYPGLLSTVTSTRYLGVTLQQDLTWDQRILNICSKTNKTLGFYRRKLRPTRPSCIQDETLHQLSATTSRVIYLILPTHTGTCISRSQHRKNSGEVLGKMQANGPEGWKLACIAIDGPAPGFKGRTHREPVWPSGKAFGW